MSTVFLKAALESAYSSGHLILLNYAQASASFATGDVDIASNEIDLGGDFTPAAVVGTRLSFTDLSLETDLSNQTVYYVVAVDGTEVQVSDTPGGSAIDLTVAVSGNVIDLPPVSTSGFDIRTEAETVADAVRHEVSSYQGLTNRPTFTDPGTATLSRAANTQWVANLNIVINASTATPVVFNYLGIITGGSATPGNTTGTLARCIGDGTNQTLGAGGTITIDLYQDGF
jgi:hypothetical protein